MDEETRLTIRIMHLAYLVHQMTDYCVFIDFSGHVDQLTISIRQSKKNWPIKVLESEFYTIYNKFRDTHAKPLTCELKARVDILEKILTDNNIPFDDCDYDEEYIRHYRF